MNLLFGKRNSVEVVIFQKYIENCGILRMKTIMDKNPTLNVYFNGKYRIIK